MDEKRLSELSKKISGKLARILAEEDYGAKLPAYEVYPNESEYGEIICTALTALLRGQVFQSQPQSGQAER